MMVSDATTEKLEEAMADAARSCRYPLSCEHCDAVRVLAAEVLAGRKRDIATRKALEEACKGHAQNSGRAICPVCKALAELGVPDGE